MENRLTILSATWARVRILLAVGLFLLFGSSGAYAVNVHLAWDANLANEQVLGYHILYRVEGSIIWHEIDAGNTVELIIPGLFENVKYFFYADAYNANGRSDPSNMIDFTTSMSAIHPATGGGIEIRFIDVEQKKRLRLEYSFTDGAYIVIVNE